MQFSSKCISNFKKIFCVLLCGREIQQVTYLRTSCSIFISCCCNSVITSIPSVRHSGRAPTETRVTYSRISSACECVFVCVLFHPTVPLLDDSQGLKLQLHVLLDHQWTKDLEVICSQNWLEHWLNDKKKNVTCKKKNNMIIINIDLWFGDRKFLWLQTAL